jgi:hypothetical protein
MPEMYKTTCVCHGYLKVKLSLCLTKYHATKTCEVVEVYFHKLGGGEWSASSFGPFTPDTHWMRGWMGPRAGMDTVEKEIPAGDRSLVIPPEVQ